MREHSPGPIRRESASAATEASASRTSNRVRAAASDVADFSATVALLARTMTSTVVFVVERAESAAATDLCRRALSRLEAMQRDD
ncbi:hypothetical protein EW145_g4937 [Phellinidium pouzarii]|uniref:Uncharacterized protein n=1 Tax=Phellinidium pouzarii TaxID=167371 RepID=A0A4S4L353_9AGAM|nr:hypothetical protein EW145_g4937 [Phellinidium pouzarii]